MSDRQRSTAVKRVALAARVDPAAVEPCLRGLTLTVSEPSEDDDPDLGWNMDARDLEPRRDVVTVGSEEIVIVIGPGGIEVAEREATWYGPAELVSGRGEVHLFDPSAWQDVDERTKAFTRLLAETRTSRRQRYELCRGCGEWIEPEHLLERNLCHGCGSRLYGVVY